MKTTTYQIESHDYDCTSTNPATCEIKGHWEITSTHRSIEAAEGAAEFNDTPAVRITQICTMVTATVIRRTNSPLPIR
jgi:hypothetical protein